MSHQKYTQLSYEERVVIETLRKNSKSIREIAESLGRNVSTISRELRRNQISQRKTRVNIPSEFYLDSRNFRGTIRVDEIRIRKESYRKRKHTFQKSNYDAKIATRKSLNRRKKQYLLLTQENYLQTKEYVDLKLKERWSPEQIAGRIKLEDKIPYVSHMAIYRYIHLFNQERYLRRKGKKKCPVWRLKYNRASRNKHNISERPQEINNLSRFGDLEGDTIFGKDIKDRLLTHVDRKTGILSVSLVRNYDACKIYKQTTKDIKRIFGEAKSITYDNGSEFTLWKQMEEELKTIIYFANPYHSWERGRNENANGLIRDFLPKGTDFKKLTQKDILDIESKINNRPRKRFQWLTPLEYAKSLDVALEGLI